MAGNSGLSNATKAKKDEFYTQLTDIEKEMRYYRAILRARQSSATATTHLNPTSSSTLF